MKEENENWDIEDWVALFSWIIIILPWILVCLLR